MGACREKTATISDRGSIAPQWYAPRGILGTLLKARDLARPEFKANPYPSTPGCGAEEPVCRISAVFMEAWLVTRYDDAVTVLRDPRISKDISSKMAYVLRFAGPLADHMLNRDPPDHTRLRTLVGQAFTPRRIEQLRGRIQAVCDESARMRPGPGTFDLVRDLRPAHPAHRHLRAAGHPARGPTAVPPPDPRRHRDRRAHRVLDVPIALPYVWLLMRYFRKLFAERRANPRDDLITRHGPGRGGRRPPDRERADGHVHPSALRRL